MPAETHSHSEPVTVEDVLELLAVVQVRHRLRRPLGGEGPGDGLGQVDRGPATGELLDVGLAEGPLTELLGHHVPERQQREVFIRRRGVR